MDPIQVVCFNPPDYEPLAVQPENSQLLQLVSSGKLKWVTGGNLDRYPPKIFKTRSRAPVSVYSVSQKSMPSNCALDHHVDELGLKYPETRLLPIAQCIPCRTLKAGAIWQYSSSKCRGGGFVFVRNSCRRCGQTDWKSQLAHLSG